MINTLVLIIHRPKYYICALKNGVRKGYGSNYLRKCLGSYHRCDHRIQWLFHNQIIFLALQTHKRLVFYTGILNIKIPQCKHTSIRVSFHVIQKSKLWLIVLSLSGLFDKGTINSHNEYTNIYHQLVGPW